MLKPLPISALNDGKMVEDSLKADMAYERLETLVNKASLTLDKLIEMTSKTNNYAPINAGAGRERNNHRSWHMQREKMQGCCQIRL